MRWFVKTLLAGVLLVGGAGKGIAEDIDLFTGSNGAPAANVLFVIDNSSNWAASNQNWPSVNVGRDPALPCGNDCDKQGMNEIVALYDVIRALPANSQVNIGLMLFNNSTASHDAGYVRVKVKPLNSTHKANLTATLLSMIQNFNTETTGSSVQYSAVLLDAFKYFGGYSNPTDSVSRYPASGVSNPTHDNTPLFGTRIWGDNNADGTKPDGEAYDGNRYNPIITSDSSCGSNYIVFIGNGFPAQEDTGTFSSVGNMESILRKLRDPANASSPAAVSQLDMPAYVTGNISTANTCSNSCNSDLTSSEKDAAYNHVCKKGSPTGTNNTSSGFLDCNYSVTFSCQKSTCNGSNLRVVASGTPAANTPWVQPTNTTKRFADEFTKFLNGADVGDVIGSQSVITYTIDVFRASPSADQTQLMRSMAYYGKGEYYSASDSSQLGFAFADILRKIISKNSVFASASLPVSATNRSQNENQVYIGLFRPDPDTRPRWFGNLKRYQITDFGTTVGLDLGDRYGQRAINQNTGFIDDCSVSFWTVDSGQYWNGIAIKPPGAAIVPSLGTQCNRLVNQTAVSAGSLSDWPDGPSVEKGSVSQVLRLGNNPAATSPSYAASGRTIYTLNGSNQLAVVDAASATDTVKFAMGFDVNDERPGATSSGTDTTLDMRPMVHGDVIHSRPIPVNYSTTSTADVVIFYGANDGTFRAVNSTDGKELWAFMNPESLTGSGLARLKNNEPLVQYPGLSYGENAKAPKTYFFDGSSSVFQSANNSTIWLYTSLRRGGRWVYAFDITNKTSPVFKWRFGCPNLTDDTGCVGGAEAANMAQSWSLPSAARIKLADGSEKKIVVFGGGYEGGYDADGNGLCDDRDNIDPLCGSSLKGRGVFVVDADTGVLLKKFPTAGPVAADIAFVDFNYDGYIDYAYAADTRGNITRVNFSSTSGVGLVTDATTLAGATSAQILYTNASSTDKGRKFLFPPAVVPYGSSIYLAIGSGDREHPLRTNYPYQSEVKNRFYVFLDNPASDGSLPTSGTSVIGYNLDSTTLMYDYTTVGDSTCAGSRSSILPGSSRKGWYLTLSDQASTSADPHRGEQVVSGALIAGGKTFFSTNSPDAGSAGQCTNTLGIARGYALNLLNGCGYVSTFEGGGLPPSPVIATVPYTAVDGSEQTGTVCIGCAQEGVKGSPIGGTPIKPSITNRRTKTYWYSNSQK